MPFNAAKDYPETTDCFALEKQIGILKQDIFYWRTKYNDSEAVVRERLLKRREEQFNIMACPAKVNAKRQAESQAIFDKYADQAKSRIETDSFKTKYVYIAFGALALLAGTVVIIKMRKG